MTELLDKLAHNKNNGNKLASSKNDNNKLVFGKNDSNSEVNEFGISRNDVEHTKKLGNLSKSGKSKSKKMFKSRNLAKSRKKLSKSRNSTYFYATEVGPKFLTPNAKTTFNCF